MSFPIFLLELAVVLLADLNYTASEIIFKFEAKLKNFKQPEQITLLFFHQKKMSCPFKKKHCALWQLFSECFISNLAALLLLKKDITFLWCAGPLDIFVEASPAVTGRRL